MMPLLGDHIYLGTEDILAARNNPKGVSPVCTTVCSEAPQALPEASNPGRVEGLATSGSCVVGLEALCALPSSALCGERLWVGAHAVSQVHEVFE